jgi:hypothetical protein
MGKCVNGESLAKPPDKAIGGAWEGIKRGELKRHVTPELHGVLTLPF